MVFYNCDIMINQIYKTTFGFSLSQLNTLKGVVSPHIYNILEQDHHTHQKFRQCLSYMLKVVGPCQPEDVKVKCNLIFNVHSVNDSLLHLRPLLSTLILNNKIQSQYELDQLTKWLTKQIKINSQIGQPQITQKLSLKDQQTLKFQQQIREISNTQQPQDMNQICKWLRNKYTMIDSKHIFECVGRIFKAKGNGGKSRKNNQIWDKIKEIKARPLKLECNSKQVYEEHLKETEGKVRFRFPPEPNGYLHVGHLKAIRTNFQTAKQLGGTCYLRYDDTNPDKETHQFIAEIEENIRWFNYSPDKVTFASDYFEELMHFAHQLTSKGHAYVCESSQEEIQLERKEKRANPYRERSIQESLKIFPNLTGSQTLRLKGIPDSPNPTLRDPIIYRQKQRAHPRTHHKYKIYPTYDFTHGICDSLQHIDYSLCSLEFQIRRELYYTFLDLLGLWKPVVWQYSRLNVEGNVLSKRKIKDFIDKGVVDGWDDPRLMTVRGLRNRGYTPDMLSEFIDKVSCSRSGNQNIVQFGLLQNEMKKQLMKKAPKCMAVLNPFAVDIINFTSISVIQSKDNLFSTLAEKNIFIDKTDSQGMIQGSTVILKNLGVFRIEKISESGATFTFLADKNVVNVKKTDPSIKIIHWINKSQSTNTKVIMYDRLLTPKGEPNPTSKTQHFSALIPTSLLLNRPEYIQFQRIGFFKFSTTNKDLHLCTKL